MLNEFNDISMDMAAAVADVYPSPYLLLEVCWVRKNALL